MVYSIECMLLCWMEEPRSDLCPVERGAGRKKFLSLNPQSRKLHDPRPSVLLAGVVSISPSVLEREPSLIHPFCPGLANTVISKRGRVSEKRAPVLIQLSIAYDQHSPFSTQRKRRGRKEERPPVTPLYRLR